MLLIDNYYYSFNLSNSYCLHMKFHSSILFYQIIMNNNAITPPIGNLGPTVSNIACTRYECCY